MEPRPQHGRGALVSDGHATAQRRDADHRGRPTSRGSYHGGNLRRLETASLNLPLYPWIDVAPNGRASTRVPTRRCGGSTRAAPGRGRASASATPSTAATAATRSSMSAESRRRRRRLERGRPRSEHQRSDAAGDRYRADGERAPSAQPHRPGRRDGPGDGRRLLRRGARGPTTTASMRPSSGIRRPVPGGRWPPNRRPASTTPPRYCCPTGACCPPGAASAVRATRSATSPRTGRCLRRRTCTRQTARASSRRARRSPRARQHRARHELPDRHPGRRLDPQGRAGPPRRRHALRQHGAALRAAVIHRWRRRADRDRARERRHRPTRRVHVVHH